MGAQVTLCFWRLRAAMLSLWPIHYSAESPSAARAARAASVEWAVAHVSDHVLVYPALLSSEAHLWRVTIILGQDPGSWYNLEPIVAGLGVPVLGYSEFLQ